MQRVSVTDAGLVVQHHEPSLVSMYGKEMRPAREWTALDGSVTLWEA